MRNHIESFGAAAQTYNEAAELQNYVATRLAEQILDSDITAKSILEIGCGTGLLTRRLRGHFGRAASYLITDAAPDMVETCRSLFPGDDKMEFGVMDGEQVTSREHRFNLIASSMTFQWFDNPEKSIPRLQTYLKRGGALHYAMPGQDTFSEWRAHLEYMGLDFGMRHLPDTLPGQYREEYITRDYGDGKTFLKMLKDTGAGTPKPDYEKPSPKNLLKAVDSFDGEVTWHIVYGKLEL